MSTRWLLTGWLILVPVGLLGAEGALKYPDGGEPTQVPRDLGNDGQPLKCLIHTADVPIYAEPSISAQVVQQANFRDFFYVAGLDSTKQFLFVVTAGTEVNYPKLPVRTCHGWIPRQYCLLFSGIYAGTGPEGLRDPRSTIHRKAMLVNRFVSNNKLPDLLTEVHFLNRPDNRGQSLCKRSLFSIYYIYAETAEFLLLGTEPRIGEVSEDAQQLLGWVPRTRVCQWNTREAVEFNKQALLTQARKQPCRIFLNEDELKAYLEKADEAAIPPVAEEDLSVTSWRHDQARFPLIESEEGPSVISVLGNRLYRIGFIGDVFQHSPQTGNLERVATAPQIESLKAKVEMLQRRIAKVQICFLIDATFSMDPWISAASDAINKIASGVTDRLSTSQAVRNMEFSVNFYRDAGDGPSAYLPTPFQPLSDALLELKKANPSGGGRPYELMFAAICKRLEDRGGAGANQRMAFDPDAVKILIVIGDDGNDPDDSEYTLDRVCRTIRQTGDVSPVGFLAFPVGAGKHRDVFITQAQAIARRLSQAELEAFRASDKQLDDVSRRSLEELTAQVVVSASADDIVTGVYKRFQFAMQEKEYYQRALEYLYAGREISADLVREVQDSAAGRRADDSAAGTPTARAYGVVWQRRMDDLIRKNGLEPLQLAAHGVQLFQEGWLAEVDPQELASSSGSPPPAIRHVVLMHKSEVARLKDFLKIVVREWNPQALQRTWKAALDEVTGGDVSLDSKLSLQELFRKHFGVKAQQGLLALKFDELGRVAPEQLLRLRMALEKCAYQLDDTLGEKMADYQPMPIGETGRKKLIRQNVRDRQYWWYGDALEELGKEPRAWIDRDMVP